MAAVLARFLTVTLVVSALVAVVSAYLSPKSLRELRRMAAEIRADLVANIVQPGRFTSLERGLTFHIRERRADGILLGIFVDDRRDPKEQMTVLAERGDILENERGTFLILDTGSVQRHPVDERDPTIVLFERYAFDLSRLTGGPQATTLSVRERFLWQLISPPPTDPMFIKEPGQFRAELHDRIMAPLYPLAFVVDRLRLSRRAAHHTAKPQPGAGVGDHRRSSAADHRIRQHGFRHAYGHCARRSSTSRSRPFSPSATGRSRGARSSSHRSS